ncbi:4-alpha-glucanotransferase [Roseobacter sinensis]|uniref:4-alpha-glucanotransferase n=1 Tax=Roseobacter sinensis TaxID=2931391 RepID=A0ABT3BHW0_9RHOB|nr:4-alpha-glucanotransferase [Roseobacter sp. WL0113]MCV3273160.1 4-alpha-glucanotransferase [Roseobacter sp. WL0113]
MSADAELAMLADICGIFDRFRDLEGVSRPTSPDTQRALLHACGQEVGSAAEVRDTLAALRAERQARVVPEELVLVSGAPRAIPVAAPTDWHLVLEETAEAHAEGRGETEISLPGLPMGVHHLHAKQGKRSSVTRVIAAPARTPSLKDVVGAERLWGVVAALYGLRSDRNAGIGDFEDLAQLAEVLGPHGASFLGLNPVHALGWAAPEVISPYSPTHRGFLNANHLALDAASARGADATDDLIDYAAHAESHRAALQAAFAAFQGTAPEGARAELAAFAQNGGKMLRDFARFECLSTRHGPDWRRWPAPLRSPDTAGPAVPPDALAFHIWLQWQADLQLGQAQARAQAAGLSLGLYLDLAIGARRDGAEAWSGGDAIARAVSLGAPPDHLSPAGQNWQLAAYAPRGLAAQDYAPLRQILRHVMRHCGILRIDHALGLNRSYWIPDNGAPGGYIRQPFEALMAIIAIEAQRAGTVIVGEDLGLVPDGFRDRMADQGVYGYTVLQYEKTDDGSFRSADDLRVQSLACFGTHDTPTIAGFHTGRDIDWWHHLDWIDANGHSRARRQRARETAELLGSSEGGSDTGTAADLAVAVHRALATAPTALAAVQLDDIIGAQEAQNLPGTVDAHPNWRRRCPVAVADLARHEGLARTAQIMTRAGRSLDTREI